MMQTIKPDKYFYLRNGEELRSIKELEKELEKNIKYENLENFYHHVNNEKNDYAEWIKNVFHKHNLYEKIRSVSKPDELLKIIKEEQNQNDKENKKVDLEKIKHELEFNKKITRKEKAKAIIKKIIKPRSNKNKENKDEDKKTIFKKILNKIRKKKSDKWMNELEKEAKKIKNKRTEEEEEEEIKEPKKTINVTEKLLIIIKEAKKTGKTNQEIKNILLKQGISSEILNKIIPDENKDIQERTITENEEEKQEKTTEKQKENEEEKQEKTTEEQAKPEEEIKKEEPTIEEPELNNERQEKTEEQKLAEEKERDLRAERAEKLLEKTSSMKKNSYLNYEKQKETVSGLRDIYEELYSEISDYRKQGKDMFMPYMNLRLIKSKLSFLEVSNNEEDRRQVMKLLEGVKKEIKEAINIEEPNIKKEVLQSAGLYEEKKED
jgi:hypothetical protein